MALLNTQSGYKLQRSTGVRATGGAPRMSSGVTRALASAAPAAPSYRSPYADPTGTLFPQTDMPTVPSTAPAGTPPAYQAQKPVVPQAPAGFSFDLETDPILQQMHAMAAKQRSDAEAGALAQRKQLAIQYGHQAGTPVDPGLYPDQATAAAAEGNPFSVTANLANEYQTGTHNLDEDLNQHNLFYSGARINELANALRDYQGQQASAAGAFQSALGNVDQNRIASLIGADQQEQGGYNDAYSRALAYALANPTVPPPPPPTTTAPTTTSPTTDVFGGMNAAGLTPNTSYADLGTIPGPVSSPDQPSYIGTDPSGGGAGLSPLPAQMSNPLANIDLASLLGNLSLTGAFKGAPVTTTSTSTRRRAY